MPAPWRRIRVIDQCTPYSDGGYRIDKDHVELYWRMVARRWKTRWSRKLRSGITRLTS